MIWIHAQNEIELPKILTVAEEGAYISLDGYRPGQETKYANLVRLLKREGFLSKIHLSQDAGWYSVGEENGGAYSPHDPIKTTLVPYLRNSVLTQNEIEQIFKRNPATAFSVKVRKLR